MNGRNFQTFPCVRKVFFSQRWIAFAVSCQSGSTIMACASVGSSLVSALSKRLVQRVIQGGTSVSCSPPSTPLT